MQHPFEPKWVSAFSTWKHQPKQIPRSARNDNSQLHGFSRARRPGGIFLPGCSAFIKGYLLGQLLPANCQLLVALPHTTFCFHFPLRNTVIATVGRMISLTSIPMYTPLAPMCFVWLRKYASGSGTIQ
jgi:hypothetical protein